MNNLKQIKNNNLKYYASEMVGVIFGLTSTSLTAYAMDKISDSNSIISIASAISGTAGATFGSITAYVGLHINDYRNKHRNLQQDISSLIKSRLEGTGTIYAVRLPLQYILQKFCGINPVIAAPISQVIAGISGISVRISRNYQRKIFGNRKSKKLKSSEKAKIRDPAGLEDCLYPD